jgi:hypothetical protein
MRRCGWPHEPEHDKGTLSRVGGTSCHHLPQDPHRLRLGHHHDDHDHHVEYHDHVDHDLGDDGRGSLTRRRTLALD